MARNQRKSRPKVRPFWIVMLVLVAVLAGILLVLRMLEREAPMPGVRLPIPGRVDTSAAPEVPATRSAVLFFGDENAEGLRRELREVRDAATPGEKAQVLMEELLRGPSGSGVPSLPEGTTLRRAYFDERSRVMYVDFSRELRTRHWGGSTGELLTIRSIVTTIGANMPNVEAVQILVEGHEVETIAGHVETSAPFPVAQWGKAGGDLGLALSGE